MSGFSRIGDMFGGFTGRLSELSRVTNSLINFDPHGSFLNQSKIQVVIGTIDARLCSLFDQVIWINHGAG